MFLKHFIKLLILFYWNSCAILVENNCIENYVFCISELLNCKTSKKSEPCWNSHDIIICDSSIKSYKYRTDSIKIEADIINEDNRSMWCCMCSLVEILCVLKEEIGLVCWQLLLLWEISYSTYLWTFFIFFQNLVNLIRFFISG